MEAVAAAVAAAATWLVAVPPKSGRKPASGGAGGLPEAAGSIRGLGGGLACSAAGLNVGRLQTVPMVKCAACRPW